MHMEWSYRLQITINNPTRYDGSYANMLEK